VKARSKQRVSGGVPDGAGWRAKGKGGGFCGRGRD